jgi:hypothetical protein
MDGAAIQEAVQFSRKAEHSKEGVRLMKKFFVFGACIAFLLAMSQLAVAAPKWPGGGWQTAVIATDDAVHQAEADAVQTGNMWDFHAGGHDIWGEADQFMYAYKEVSGDFDVAVTVHVLDVDHVNDWSKAGIMARQTLDAGSTNVSIFCRGLDDLVTFQQRAETDGGSSSERATPSGAPRPVTLRLVRTGDEFNPGWSLDGGATWETNVSNDGVSPTSPIILEMSDPILLGIAATSHSAGVMMDAQVEVLGDVTTAVRPAEKLSVSWGAIKAH